MTSQHESLHRISQMTLSLLFVLLHVSFSVDFYVYDFFLFPQSLLSVHDIVARKSYDPELPPLPDDIDDEEDSVKIIRLVKNKEPLVRDQKLNLLPPTSTMKHAYAKFHMPSCQARHMCCYNSATHWIAPLWTWTQNVWHALTADPYPPVPVWPHTVSSSLTWHNPHYLTHTYTHLLAD